MAKKLGRRERMKRAQLVKANLSAPVPADHVRQRDGTFKPLNARGVYSSLSTEVIGSKWGLFHDPNKGVTSRDASFIKGPKRKLPPKRFRSDVVSTTRDDARAADVAAALHWTKVRLGLTKG